MTRLFFNPLSGLFYYLQPKRRVRRKAPAGPEVEALRTRAKAELPARLQELAAAHGFTYARVCIKNNVSNWGSCSVKGNINLNLRLLTLPERLQDFHALLETVCPGHRELEKELRTYRIR